MFIRGGGGMPVALIGLAGALIPAYRWVSSYNKEGAGKAEAGVCQSPA